MLNKQIESLRRKMGWSQVELAKRLNISPSAVGMYEQGRREPSIEVLIALSQTFEVTIDYLITGNHRFSQISAPEEITLEALSALKNLSREELIVLLAAHLMAQ